MAILALPDPGLTARKWVLCRLASRYWEKHLSVRFADALNRLRLSHTLTKLDRHEQTAAHGHGDVGLAMATLHARLPASGIDATDLFGDGGQLLELVKRAKEALEPITVSIV